MNIANFNKPANIEQNIIPMASSLPNINFFEEENIKQLEHQNSIDLYRKQNGNGELKENIAKLKNNIIENVDLEKKTVPRRKNSQMEPVVPDLELMAKLRVEDENRIKPIILENGKEFDSTKVNYSDNEERESKEELDDDNEYCKPPHLSKCGASFSLGKFIFPSFISSPI